MSMSSTSTSTDTASPSLAATVRLVARREIHTKLRDKAYLAGMGVMLAILIAGLVVNAILISRANGPAGPVAAVGPQATQLAEKAGLTTRTVPDRAAGISLLTSTDDDRAVKAVVQVEHGRVHLTGATDVDDAIQQAFTQSPTINLLTPSSPHQGALLALGIGFAVVFFMVSVTFGMGIAQSVVEEKETRIVEILVASIPVRALLAGKVIGNTLLAIGQVAVLALLAFIGTHLVASGGAIASLLGGSIVWLLVFFLLGFTLMAGLWAVAGALAGRTEDLSSTTMPMQLVLMIPFFASVYSHKPNTLMRVLSYIPFSSPFAMPRRILVGDTAWWEPLAALALLLATIALVIMVCARIYSGALLQTTGKANLARAWTAGGSDGSIPADAASTTDAASAVHGTAAAAGSGADELQAGAARR